jgi:hypothetical protein
VSRGNNKKRAAAVQRASMPQQQGGSMMVIPQSMLQAILMQQSPQKNTQGESMLPGAPLVPYKGIMPKDGVRVWNYPIGWNIGYLSRSTQPDQQTIPTFQQLRNFARTYDGFQLCLRVWLDLIMKLKLQIKPRPDLIQDGDDEDDPKWQKLAKPYYEFFEKPDKQLDLHQWLRKAITDQLEIDALCIYMRPTKGGGLYSMDVVDGTTIKPLLDDRGRPPDPPFPAYQQYLYAGLPGPWLTSEQLLYIRESPRTDTPYGISRVERIVTRIQQALRKQSKDLAMFTDGNIPPGLLQLPQTDSDWTSDEVQAYQQMFDSLLAGNDQQRSRIRVVPPGTTYAPLDDMEMTTEFDKFLLNVTVAAMGLSMADLGFTEDVNRSSGDSQENMTYRRTMQPLMNMYAELFTRVLRDYFDEDRFVVTWGGFEESEDLEMQASAYSNMVQHGIISPSDAARAMRQPVHFEIGPLVITKDGPIMLEDFADPEFRKAQKAAHLAGLQMAANPPQPQQQPQQNGQEKDQEVPAKDGKGNVPPTQSAQPAKQKDEENSKNETQPAAKRAAIGEAVPVFEKQEQATETGQVRTEDAERSGEVQHIAQVARSKDDATASNGASEDYRRWRQRSIDDVKSGRALRSFTSALIPPHIHGWISGELAQCTSVEEVRDVFNRARDMTSNAPIPGGGMVHWQDADKETMKTLNDMRRRGVTKLTWVVNLASACDQCVRNNRVTVAVGDRFPTGCYCTPEHGNCDCKVVEE